MAQENDFGTFTDAALVDLWEQFLRSYHVVGDLAFYYMDQLTNLRSHNLKTIRVNYGEHLADYNLSPDFVALRYMTSYDPDKSKLTLREAALRILKEMQPDFYNEVWRVFRAEIENATYEKEIPDLSNDDCGHLVKVTGLLTTRDEKSGIIIHSTVWLCEYGHKNEVQGTDRPKRCKGPYSGVSDLLKDNPEEISDGPKESEVCDSLRFQKDEKGGLKEDYIRFDIQQRNERSLDNSSPPSILVEVIGPDNVGYVKKKVAFGQYVTVTGIPRTKPNRYTTGQEKRSADIYLEASTIEILPESYFKRDVDPALDEIVKDTIRHDLDPVINTKLEQEGLDKMINSVAPTLHMAGQDRLIKELFLMWLVGSDPLKYLDGTRLRGEGQLLYIGDPGIGKSVLGDYARQVRPRTLYNSSGKSTSVGLVGGLNIDKDGIQRITSGVFGLAKNAAVILDEFAGRPDKDYMDLLEPLSDMQTVTIAKGSHYRETKVNTAVLAIANPSTQTRYYNANKSIFENTKIPSQILQRFDAIIIRRDEAVPIEDEARSDHYFETQADAVTEEEFYQNRPDKFKTRKQKHYGIDYVARWLEWVRATFHPRLAHSRDAVQVVKTWYLKTRNMRITITEEGPRSQEEVSIPAADMRKLGAVTRFAQMHARACQRDYVTKEDALRACFYIDMSLAEAGAWKYGGSGGKEYVKDPLQAYQEKERKKWDDLFRAQFSKKLEDLSFEKCYQCKGSGEIIQIGQPAEGCSNCLGWGRMPIPFSKNHMIVELVGEGTGRMNLMSFNTIWAEWEKKNMIVLHDDGERYRNLMPWTGTVPKARSGKDWLKEKAMRDHPGMWKKFVRETKR